MLYDLESPAGVPPAPQWFALYTRHQHEKAVAEILDGKGFDTFLPLYTVVHQWKDRAKTLKLPLFPCYVFLKGGLQRRQQILTTPGVFNFVSSAGQPSVVPPFEIEALQRVVSSGVPFEAHPFLKFGDRVRVKSGPLSGIEGILVRKKNVSRLVLSVDMLGKSAAVEVDALQVEAIRRNVSAAVQPYVATANQV